MLNLFARDAVSRVLRPLGDRLARAGVSADAVTVLGTVGAVAGAVVFFGRGILFTGTVVITVFVLLDLVDGALARASGKGTKYGAVLDSTCDRVADAAIFGALAWWYAGPGDDRALLLACLLCLVFGSLTSYVKARAEGLGLTCDVGVAERAERLLIVLVPTGLSGLGVPYILPIGLWVLVGLSAITVVQRLADVHRQSRELDRPDAEAPGATDEPEPS